MWCAALELEQRLSQGLFMYTYNWMIDGVRHRENIGRHTWAVILKFFAERTCLTKSQMSTKKQLNIIVNNKQRN